MGKTDFIVIGNLNACGYKSIFYYIKDNEMWLGYNKMSDFIGYDGKVGKVVCRWFTNVHIDRLEKKVDLHKTYSDDYLHYANYDAIEVPKISDIPADYDGVMAVPLSFFDEYCPSQFEIVGYTHNPQNSKGVFPYYKKMPEELISICKKNRGFRLWTPTIIKDGKVKVPYARILIRKRNEK